jgi:glycosyltransferase involved in cell wall biosynthesis
MSSHRFFPTSMADVPVTRSNGRVSILMRTKDRPVLLARAFASVLAQSHANWELRLVNDGGEQAPVDALVRQYEGAFAGRIVVRHHATSVGMEAASNAALEGATGEYVVVHDDDDSWKPSFLEETVAFLEAPEHTHFAAVATNCIVVHEEIVGATVVEHERQTWGYWREHVDFMSMLVSNNFPPICLLIRKSVVDAIGPFNAALPVLGDWDYNLRILMVGDIGTIAAPLAYYHHRRSAAGPQPYGNSVTAGQRLHQEYQTRYRNSMVRQLLAKDPAFAGLLHVLLLRQERLEAKFVEPEATLAVAHLRRELKPLIDIMNAVLWPFRMVIAAVTGAARVFRRRT